MNRRSYRRLSNLPAWGLYDESEKLVASIRASSASEARRLFHLDGLQGARVRRVPPPKAPDGADWDNIPASELREGDEIRLLFMGGTEDVRVTHVRVRDRGLIYWQGWNSVTGDVDDEVAPDQIVRRVK